MGNRRVLQNTMPPFSHPRPEAGIACRFGGGVHNGSVIKRTASSITFTAANFPHPKSMLCPASTICADIGISPCRTTALTSKSSPNTARFSRKGEDRRFSFEDVCVVSFRGKYYMYLNRRNWKRIDDPSESGICMAVSDDLFALGNARPLYSLTPNVYTGIPVLSRTRQRSRDDKRQICDVYQQR